MNSSSRQLKLIKSSNSIHKVCGSIVAAAIMIMIMCHVHSASLNMLYASRWSTTNPTSLSLSLSRKLPPSPLSKGKFHHDDPDWSQPWIAENFHFDLSTIVHSQAWSLMSGISHLWCHAFTSTVRRKSGGKSICGPQYHEKWLYTKAFAPA